MGAAEALCLWCAWVVCAMALGATHRAWNKMGPVTGEGKHPRAARAPHTQKPTQGARCAGTARNPPLLQVVASSARHRREGMWHVVAWQLYHCIWITARGGAETPPA